VPFVYWFVALPVGAARLFTYKLIEQNLTQIKLRSSR
jgi:hypothetical protein